MLTQLHWAALQVVAWGGMLISYSARSGIETGIRETFDGDHPCPMCTAIKTAKERENPSQHLDALTSLTRLIAIAPPVTRIEPPARALAHNLAGPPPAITLFPERPPVPPPRLLRG